MYIKDYLKKLQPKNLRDCLGLSKKDYIALDYKFKNNIIQVGNIIDWFAKCGEPVRTFELTIKYNNGKIEVFNLMKPSVKNLKLSDYKLTAELLNAKIKFEVNGKPIRMFYPKK